MARILFFCINGVGLGHAARILALARQVRKRAPDSEILVITSSENSHIFSREGIPSVKVPSPTSKGWDRRLPVAELAHALTAQTVAIFRPHLAVVDSMPAGLFGEYLSPLMIVPKRVFIFGRFPDHYSNSHYKTSLKQYGRILVPYIENERDQIGVKFGDDARWVGDILVRSKNEILAREDARRRIRVNPEELVIYVGLGGGGNPQNDEILTWLLDCLSNYPQIKIACAVQPLAKGHDIIFKHANCVPVNHFPMSEYFSAFDIAVSAAGANSAELIYAGVPAIFIPLGYPSTDQEFNANRFSKIGLGHNVAPMDTKSFTDAVDDLLVEKNRENMSAKMLDWAGPNGAEIAADEIVSYLES